MLHMQNVVSDIKLHPQKIAKRFIVDKDVVKVSGIILQKPFKLQITAIAKINGKKKKRVRSLEFTGTLREAVDDALQLRKAWKDELKAEIITDTSTTKTIAVDKMLTLSQAWELYRKAKKIKFTAKGLPYDDYRDQKLYDKHIRPVLGGTLLDNIDTEDVQAITNAMIVKRAKLDDDGNKIPSLDKDGVQLKYSNNTLMYVMEERPASERTKRSIYQLISPIYSYVNKSNKIKFSVNSPATVTDLPELENVKTVTVEIDSFKKLYHYEDERYRNFFVWLMHGRRFGEVATLTYDDIDFDKGTYTIKKENNKARVNMTYKLTQWQLETLKPNGDGIVFHSVNNSEKTMNSGTLQAHFKLPCTLHDLRHVLGNTLVNSGTPIEVIGRILGHKPSKNVITNRYAKVEAEVANDALVKVLKEVLV